MRDFNLGKKVNEEVANVVKETINPSFIKDMIRGFVNIPTEVIMRPKAIGKYLQILTNSFWTHNDFCRNVHKSSYHILDK